MRGAAGRVVRGVGPVKLVGLGEAREIALRWRRLARDGIDPKTAPPAQGPK